MLSKVLGAWKWILFAVVTAVGGVVGAILSQHKGAGGTDVNDAEVEEAGYEEYEADETAADAPEEE